MKKQPQIRKIFLQSAILLSLVAVFGVTPAFAHRSPDDCTGSALSINLYTDISKAHIGDVISYSLYIFNGSGTGPVACDATDISASLVTPDGQSHSISLTRTELTNGQSDSYSNVVTYTARTEDVHNDILPATARVIGTIHQNNTDSEGGGDQGVNVKVLTTTVTPPAFNVTCPAIDSSVKIGQEVTRKVEISGGTSPYQISWSGTDGLTGDTDSVSITYTSAGKKEGSVTVIDADNKVVTTSCNTVVVTKPPSGGGGGHRNPPKPDVSLLQVTEPAPLAEATVVLSSGPYTGINDYPKSVIFLIGVAFWTTVLSIFYFVRSRRKIQTR